jgi:oligopeptide transport system permease protein
MTARIRIALIVLGTLALFALIAPLLTPWSHAALDWQNLAMPPQLESAHWLGTDRLGRDLFARGMQALRISLALGVLATLVSVGIGIAWGARGGLPRRPRRCGHDALRGHRVCAAVRVHRHHPLDAVSARQPRGAVHRHRRGGLAHHGAHRARADAGAATSEFVEAAIAGGVRTPAILWRHIVPNVMGTVIAYGTLTIPQVILFESFLSFLGLGVQEPFASLGSLIYEGAQEMESSPWMLLVPAGLLMTLLLAFNALGDALRARPGSDDD